jgi:hypothetical protein
MLNATKFSVLVLGGSGTGLVPPITNTTTLTQYSSSLVKGLELINLNFYF